MRRGGHALRVHLPQSAEIIERPERTALGGRVQIVVSNLEIRDRYDRQVPRQRLPVGTCIEGDVDPGLGTGVEQATPNGILADDPNGLASAKAVRDARPRLPIVRRL